MAYRRLPDVLAEHAGTIWVLRPFAVAMASNGEFDPFGINLRRNGLRNVRAAICHCPGLSAGAVGLLKS